MKDVHPWNLRAFSLLSLTVSPCFMFAVKDVASQAPASAAMSALAALSLCTMNSQQYLKESSFFHKWL